MSKNKEKIEQLKLDEELLTLRNDISFLRQNLITSQTSHLSSAKLTTKSGSLSIDENYNYVALNRVYEAVNEIMDELAVRVQAELKDATSLVILDESEYENIVNYSIILKQVNWLIKQANSLNFTNDAQDMPLSDLSESKSLGSATTLGVGLGAVEGILASTASISSIFKSDRNIKSHAFKISEQELAAKLFMKLNRESLKAKIYFPKAFALQPNLETESLLLQRLSELLKHSVALQQSNSGIASALSTRITSFMQTLEQDGETQGILKSLLSTETLTAKVESDSSRLYIILKLSAAQGSILTKDGFWRSTSLHAAGAAALSYFLFNQESQILDAAAISHQTDYIKINLS